MLVAIEDEYRAYQSVIAAGIEVLRPGVEVLMVRVSALEEEIERCSPQVVVSTGPDAYDDRGGRPAWVELSLAPTRPTKVHIGGRYLELRSFAMESLLEVIDEVERLARMGQNSDS